MDTPTFDQERLERVVTENSIDLQKKVSEVAIEIKNSAVFSAEDTAKIVECIKKMAQDIRESQPSMEPLIESIKQLAQESEKQTALAKEGGPKKYEADIANVVKALKQLTEKTAEADAQMGKIVSLVLEIARAMNKEKPAAVEPPMVVDSSVTIRGKLGEPLEITDTYSDGTKIVAKVSYGK